MSEETEKEKRATFFARLPVEPLVVVLVVIATITIFTVRLVTGGRETTSLSSLEGGIRHDAISAEEPASSQESATPVADQDTSFSQHSTPSSRVSLSDGDTSLKALSGDTLVYNGVTVLSPTLLVPVITADAIQMSNGSEILPTPPHKTLRSRKHFHYVRRAHTHAQRHLLLSDPFSRFVAK